MTQNRIFREELPGEKKSIVNLLMTGFIVTISCLGYMAFYLTIQLEQIDRIVQTLNMETLSAEQFDLIRERVSRSTSQLQNEVIGLAVIGSLVAIIGGIYSIQLVLRPLRRLVEYADTGGKTQLPEFKTNNEIKQLATALTDLTSRLTDSPSRTKS